MTAVNFTGFETGDTSEIGPNIINGTGSIQSSITNGSAYAFRANPAAGVNGCYTLEANDATGSFLANGNTPTAFVRFYFRAATLPASSYEMILRCNPTNLTVAINSSGQLVALDTNLIAVATGTTSLSTGVWYRIEAKSGTGASAAWEVKINGVSEISGTSNLGTTNNASYSFGKQTDLNNNAVDFYYDDAYIDDAAYPGPGQCVLLKPSANGDFANGTANGAATLWQCVNEVPPNGDTSYINAIGNGNACTFVTTPAGSTSVSGTVNCAKTVVRPRRDGLTNGNIIVRCRSGTTNSDTTGIATTLAYQGFGRVLPTDPSTGSAWTPTGVNAAQPGVVENSANASRVTAAYLVVDFTPPPPAITMILTSFPAYFD